MVPLVLLYGTYIDCNHDNFPHNGVCCLFNSLVLFTVTNMLEKEKAVILSVPLSLTSYQTKKRSILIQVNFGQNYQ